MSKRSYVTDDSGGRVAVDVTSDDGRTTDRWSYGGNIADDRGDYQGSLSHKSDGTSSWRSKKDGARSSGLGSGK